MERKKNCVICGAVYIAKSNKAKYCSKKCHDIAFRINHGIAVNSDPEPFHKTCKVCGNSFDTRREAQNTCSHECAIKWHKEMRPGKKRARLTLKECAICGKSFETSQSAQKTCLSEECKTKYRKMAHKIRNERAKEKKPPRLIVYEIRECKECGELFSVDSRMNNVYCSKDCRRKAENRRADTRIPKAQRVDNISLKRLYKRDSGICYICGGKCDWNSQAISKNGNPYPGDLYPVIEHVIPISKGGLDAWDNVRLAHWKCNLEKLDGLIDVEPMSKEVAYSQKFSKSQPKRTAQYSLDGKLIRIWDSTAQIRRELGLNDKHIQNVCRGHDSNTGNAYGYHWEYVDDKNGDRQINTA